MYKFKKDIKNITSSITFQGAKFDNIAAAIIDQDAKFNSIKKQLHHFTLQANDDSVLPI